MLQTSFRRFRTVAFAEGTSFILLVGVGMPLKYLADLPYPNKVLGMLHGVLTVLYLFALIEFALEHKISFKQSVLFLVASLLPFGTFYADKKWLKPLGKALGELS